jgi:hypothetical protein
VYADRKPRASSNGHHQFSDAEDSVGDSSSTSSSGSESESESDAPYDDVEAGVAFKPGARQGPSQKSRHQYLPASVSSTSRTCLLALQYCARLLLFVRVLLRTM